MTIKTRNYFFLALVIAFSGLLLASSAMLGYSIYTDTLTRPDVFPAERIAGFYTRGYSFIATIASLFIFALYALLAVIYLSVEFEKTQSTEVIFFALFLVGCFSETARLCTPLFNLWHELSAFLLCTGRIVLFGRTLAPTTLLFGAVFSGTEARQHVERNLVILVVLSVMISMLMPLNTAVVLPNFCIKWGNGEAFIAIRALILAAAILSLFVNARSLGTKEASPLGFAAVAFGYEISCYATSYAAASAGGILLFGGTAVYLKSLHRKYLWQ